MGGGKAHKATEGSVEKESSRQKMEEGMDNSSSGEGLNRATRVPTIHNSSARSKRRYSNATASKPQCVGEMRSRARRTPPTDKSQTGC